MNRFNDKAIVLKAIPYKDTDKLFSLFTLNKGLVLATAKGIRSPNSRRSGSLDTLNLVSIGFYESTNGYLTITEVNGLNSFQKIKESLESSAYAYFLLELLTKTTEENHASPEIFDLFVKTLNSITKYPEKAPIFVSYFCLEYLIQMGYYTDFIICDHCGDDLSLLDTPKYFVESLGSFSCEKCSHKGYKLMPTAYELLLFLVNKDFQSINISKFFETELFIRHLLTTYLSFESKSLDVFK